MKTLAFLSITCLPMLGQTAASLSPPPNLQFFNTSTGASIPCVGCSLYTYSAGTLTPLATYVDYTGTTTNANPIVLDSGGYTPSGIWIKGSCYKFILQDASAVTIWTQDQICDNAQLFKAALAASNGATLIGFEPTTGTVATTVAAALNSAFLYDIGYSTFPAACSAAIGANKTLVVITSWTGLGTQSCAADLAFAKTGKLQPGATRTVTLTGAILAPARQQIFDTSLSTAAIRLSSNCCTAISPNWWGAVADWNGSAGTDNLLFFRAAILSGIAASVPMQMLCGSYYLTGSLTINYSGGDSKVWGWSGCPATRNTSTNYGSYLVFSSGGIVYSGYAQSISARNFGVIALVAGGPNLSIQGNSGFDDFTDMSFISFNAAQSLVDADAGASGDLDGLNFDGVEFSPATAYSAVPIYFHTSGGAIAPISFNNRYRRQWTGKTGGTVPFFKADCSLANPCRAFAFSQILTEVTPYGAFEFNNVTSVDMSNVTIADSNPPHAAQIKITAPAGQTIGQYNFTNNDIQDGTADLISPSLLVAFGSSNGRANITSHGGIINYIRFTGNSVGASLISDNTKHADLYDWTPLSSIALAGSPGSVIPQGASLGLNTSSLTGRASLMSVSGAFTSDAKCTTASNLAIDATDTHKVTSASWTAVAADIGSYLYIYSGSGFYTGPDQIVNVTGGAAILQSEVGTAGSTSGVFSVSRGMLGFEWNRNAPGNSQDEILTCTANADSTVTQKTIPQTIISGAYASLPTVNKPTYAIITDPNTVTWGATITAGGGASGAVLAFWSVSNWTVVGLAK